MQEIKIGRFILKQMPNGDIFIGHNAESEVCGEGGVFTAAEVEKAIEQFYVKHF